MIIYGLMHQQNNENDHEILSLIKGKPSIILLNKSDLDMIVTKEKFRRHILK